MQQLNYKTAKKLKDAGFPQEFRAGHWICEHNILDPLTTDEMKGDNCCGEQLISYPTLEELIDEIGGAFKSLTYYDENRFDEDEKQLMRDIFGENLKTEWRCLSYDFDGYIAGKTPLEACANLYLSLNK